MPAHCEAMAALKDLDDIYEHLNSFCFDCKLAQIRDAANGEELIFTEGPPSWIAAEEAREAAVRAEEQRQAGLAAKRAAIAKKRAEAGEDGAGDAKITKSSSEEEQRAALLKMAETYSDRHLEHEIRKLTGKDDAAAADLRLELKREIALKKRAADKLREKKEEEDEESLSKEKIPRKEVKQQMQQKRPWQPTAAAQVAIADPRRSALSVEEQKRYVAILTNFNTAEQAIRFEQNRQDLKFMDDRVEEERAVMDKLVRERLATTNISMKEIGTEVNQVLQRWSARYLNDVRKFERLRQIPWEAELMPQVAKGLLRPTLQRMLMAAPAAKLNLPLNMHDRIGVSYEPYKFDPQHQRKHDPIARDTTLLNLCVDNGCAVAMEATTAVHLMSRPCEPRNYAFNVPVTVIDQFMNGVVVRLCLLGKPRPQSGVTNLTLLHMVAKYRAKSTFIADKKGGEESSTSKLAAAAAAFAAEKMKKEEEGEKEAAEKPAESGNVVGASLIDSILGSISSTIAPSTSSGAASTALGGGPPKKSTTSHSYGLFVIPSAEREEAKIIVRSSGGLQNLAKGGTVYSLNAKVELACDAGAIKPTDEETLWTSMKTTFKGAVNSATIHMHPFMKDALQISHARAFPQMTTHNESLGQLLNTRTEHLSRLLADLSKMAVGEYLLQVSPREDEITVFRENKLGNELFFNKAPRRLPGNINVLDSFTGIDEKRVLQWQVMQGRAPLTLWPEGHTLLGTYHRALEKKEGGGKGQKRKSFHPPPEMGPNFLKNQKQRANKRRRKFEEAAKGAASAVGPSTAAQ